MRILLRISMYLRGFQFMNVRSMLSHTDTRNFWTYVISSVSSYLMHSIVFPTETTLQLKISIVRTFTRILNITSDNPRSGHL